MYLTIFIRDFSFHAFSLQKKFKRLKLDDDSDEGEEGDGRDKIANEIFEGSDVSHHSLLLINAHRLKQKYM